MTRIDRRMRSAGIAALLVVAAAGSASATATKVFRQTTRQGLRGGRGDRQHDLADRRGRCRHEDHARAARRRVRLVLGAEPRRTGRVLRHRRPGKDLRGRHQGAARRRREAGAQGRRPRRRVGHRAGGAQRRNVAGGHHARRPHLQRRSQERQRPRVDDPVGRPRLEPGLRRAHRRHLRRHRIARQGVRDRRQGPRARALGFGRQARRVAGAGAGRRARAAGRHVGGGDPLSRVPRGARRGAAGLRGRRSARDRADARRDLRRGQRLREGLAAGGGRAGRREGDADHADRRVAVVGGLAAAAGTAQGQGRALSLRARRAHRADLLARRRIPDRGAARRRWNARHGRRIDRRRGRRLRRDRHAGQGLPRLQGSHRRAGAGSARAPGAGAGARRRELPRRHRRRRRRLPRAALGGRGRELSVEGARRRVPVALGHAALARHAEPGGGDAIGEHRQARRELERLAQARSPAGRERRVGRPRRQPRRALYAVSRRPGRRGRAPARRQHLLRAAEPARAGHRADAGRSVAAVVVLERTAAPGRACTRRC